MALNLRFPTLFSAFRHLGYAMPPCYWGECPHCVRSTPWHSTTDRGKYQCTVCGQDCLQP